MLKGTGTDAKDDTFVVKDAVGTGLVETGPEKETDGADVIGTEAEAIVRVAEKPETGSPGGP